jgi:NADPH:quinone reductase-like Zn-dependent oxidoreductase
MAVQLETVTREAKSTQSMKAVRIHRFGPPSVMVYEDVARPAPNNGEVLIRVMAAGVGPWDGWIRGGKSVIGQPLPLTLGSDLSGVVESVGPGVQHVRPGDEVFGVTNKRFVGSYAEYAIAEAGMIAPKPRSLGYIQAASIPVVAVTAWQMLIDYARVTPGQRVLIHGAGGNVGRYAVQLARWAGLHVQATARGKDISAVRALGADVVIDAQAQPFEQVVQTVDVVIDTVGGDIADRSYGVINPNGILVSAVTRADETKAKSYGIRAVFFLVDVTTWRLETLGKLFDTGALKTDIGEVLPLGDACSAHDMLEGAPHKRGKIVLNVSST